MFHINCGPHFDKCCLQKNWIYNNTKESSLKGKFGPCAYTLKWLLINFSIFRTIFWSVDGCYIWFSDSCSDSSSVHFIITNHWELMSGTPDYLTFIICRPRLIGYSNIISMKYMHTVDSSKNWFSNCSLYCRDGSEEPQVANGSPTCTSPWMYYVA